ncbi:Ig-like domain-containing protein, partial [Nocardioides massiliensis]
MSSRRRTVLLPRVGGGRPPRRLLVVLALVLSVTAVTAYFSGATYVSGTQSQVTINAAPDLTPPTVSLSVPATVSGTATIAVTAADVSGVVTRVVVQRQRDGGAWTDVCVRTAAPWGCSWDTTTVADGDAQLRAIATDSALLSTTSATVTTRVANAGTVVITPLPDAVRGAVDLAATVSGAAGRTMTSAFAVRNEGGTWTNVCTGRTGATPTCSWSAGTTTRFADVRVQTVFGSGTSATTAQDQTRVLVDGTNPTVSLSLPGTLTAAVTVAPNVADAHSGVASVRIDYRRLGLFGIPASGWQEVCTTTSAPWSCVLDTTALNGGANYEVRVTATDRAGNTNSDSATARVSILAALAITSPRDSDTVSGVLEPTVSANAGLLGSVSWVRLNYRRAGTGTWIEICTDSSAPYSCSWDTRDLPNGSYELRAETPPAVGTTSDVITVDVDNPPIAAL